MILTEIVHSFVGEHYGHDPVNERLKALQDKGYEIKGAAAVDGKGNTFLVTIIYETEP